MFRGQHEHSIDAKGRTSLPARFREVLTGRGESCVVITKALGPFLDVYPLREWEAFEAKLGEHSQFDKRLDFVRRHYLGNANECEVDKLGRVNLPAALRAHGKLEETALWIGVGRRIELWQPALFAAHNPLDLDTAESVDDAKARLAELGL